MGTLPAMSYLKKLPYLALTDSKWPSCKKWLIYWPLSTKLNFKWIRYFTINAPLWWGASLCADPPVGARRQSSSPSWPIG